MRVEPDGTGRPTTVYLSGRRCDVEAVLETWRIDEEWWRKRPVSRLYFSLLLKDGRAVTVYWDLARSAWFSQSY